MFYDYLQSTYQGDEMFWYETTELMVRATLNDYENRYAKRTVSVSKD